jgi:hypothetical protein
MKNLYKALADFQQEVPVIHKDTAGFNYSYADLPKVFEVIMPLLKKHGLGFYQTVGTLANETQASPVVTTVVFHIETGEQISGSTLIPQGVQMGKMNDFQVLGYAITYIRRYALSAMLGLVTDKDTDAHGEQSKSPAKAQNATSKASKPTSTTMVSSFLDLAKNALNNATTDEDVAEVKKKVETSPNLTEQEKQFLYDEIVLKLEGIPFK